MAKPYADPSRERADRHARRLDKDLHTILIAAAGALIDQFHSVGIGDPADIAGRLNRRGFPCFGRGRWTAGAVRSVLRRRAREDGPEMHPASAVAPRPHSREPMRAS